MKKLLFGILSTLCFLSLTSCNTSSKSRTTSSKGRTTATKNNRPKTSTAPNIPVEEKTMTLINFISSDDIDGVLLRAKKEKKVLFIDFYTSWCAPCKVMEQSVFQDVLVADYMNQNCICIRVNAEKDNGPNMKIAYAIDAYPTMLFYSSKGDEVARKIGSMGIEEFKKYMKASVWKAKNPVGEP